MDADLDLILSGPHADAVRALLDGSGTEKAAYLLLGAARIADDPWSGRARLRLISHRFVEIPEAAFVERSKTRVTWSTEGFMRLLGEAKEAALFPAIIHTHPGTAAFFSEQDDRNERELARTVANKGLPGLVSIVVGGSGDMRARLWTGQNGARDAERVFETGRRLRNLRPGQAEPGPPVAHLDRQARLFGADFNVLLRDLRIGVVGCGGTGSAVATLLARLGVGRILLIDRDLIETTNLNRVHGSRRQDVAARRPKATMLRDGIHEAELGVEVVALTTWVGDPLCDDALKACDIVFGCTDDHAGRAFLNRLAYFYGIPLIDVGLSMRAAKAERSADVTARVSTHLPGHTCMTCVGLIDPATAAAQSLERNAPEEYARRKAEAYVVGGGDPAPAVVTFTTEAAAMAVNELVEAIAGFREPKGMAPMLVRKFHLMRDLSVKPPPSQACALCGGERWGRGDVEPFMDLLR